MRVNRKIDEFIVNDIFYSDGRLFKIDSSINLNEYSDKKKLDYTENKIQDYIYTDRYVFNKDFLLPNEYSEKNKTEQIILEGENTGDSVCFEKEDRFPNSFLKISLDTLVDAYRLSYSFDILLTAKERRGGMDFVTHIVKADGMHRFYNLTFQFGAGSRYTYNKWHHIDKEMLIKKANFKYINTDELKLYFWNTGNEEGIIKNVTYKVTAINFDK
jgi:hypothetical protein